MADRNSGRSGTCTRMVGAVGLLLAAFALQACAQGAGPLQTNRNGADAAVPFAPPANRPPREYGECGNDRQPCCGGLCNNGIPCASGTCQARSSCGSPGQPCCPGNSCNGQVLCTNGMCPAAAPGTPGAPGGGAAACGHDRQVCCRAGTPCLDGLICGTTGMCAQAATAGCGDTRKPCCTGTAQPCANGLECKTGVCLAATACGGPREACCATGTQCRDGMSCQGGVCATTQGTCGGRGQACCPGNTCSALGTSCCGGSCVDTQADSRNCGSCGRTCDTRCERGACTAACGADGQTCCAGGGTAPCRAGLDCLGNRCQRPVGAGGTRPDAGTRPPADAGTRPPADAGTRPPAATCGVAQTACSTQASCCSGLSCRAVESRSTQCCREASQSCTSYYDCCGNMLCEGGRCVCRSASQTCSANSDCCVGLSCAAGVCVAPAGSDPCTSHTSGCGECTADPACGWCAASNICLSGNGFGPHAGSCSDWDYYPDQCGGGSGGICDVGLGTCNECTDKSVCGWCPSTRSCHEGTSTGPNGVSCPDWTWLPSVCGGTPTGNTSDACASATNCGECATRPGCGWCAGMNSCVSGTYDGPNVGAAYCGGWAWNTSSCPPVGGSGGGSDACAASANSCEDCLWGECGWRSDTRTCVHGTEAGPDGSPGLAGWVWWEGTCGGGSNSGDDYGDGSNCWSHSNCSSCIDDPVCGWCGATGSCVAGNSDGSGPSDGSYCDPQLWNWWQCTGSDTTCAGAGTCDGCTSIDVCGWCPSTGQCAVGLSDGSNAANFYCSDWIWARTECTDTTDYWNNNPADDCSSAWTCDQCIQMNTCGWCDGQCVVGDSAGNGPADGGYCDAWAWTSTQCYAPADNGGGGGGGTEPATCSDIRECGACAEVEGCGWCDDWGQCADGDGSGPAGSYFCENWTYFSDQC